jgi:hypothetical protein
MCEERWRDFEWFKGGEHDTHVVDLEFARLRVEYLVEQGKMNCHESFGRYVGLYHKAVLAIPSSGTVEFHLFDDKHCIWRTVTR